MQLPTGGVERHFTRPGGASEVSIWAVRGETARRLYGSAAVLGALAVIWLIAAILKRKQGALRRLRHSLPRLIGYPLLLLVFAGFGGWTGLCVALLILLAVEFVAMRLRRRRAQV